jgi:hypothetical protein
LLPARCACAKSRSGVQNSGNQPCETRWASLTPAMRRCEFGQRDGGRYPDCCDGTKVDYPTGSSPKLIAFDGTSIWITNSGSNTCQKWLQGTYSGATADPGQRPSSPVGQPKPRPAASNTAPCRQPRELGMLVRCPSFAAQRLWFRRAGTRTVGVPIGSRGTA